MPHRRRINLSVSPDTYDRAQSLADEFGFRSVTHMTGRMLDTLVTRKTAPSPCPPPEPDEIDLLFDEMQEWQRANGQRWDINQRQ